jgi:hypothetical protein
MSQSAPLDWGGINGAGGFVGKIAEIIICDAALSSEDITSVQTYLNDRWSVF